MKRTPLTRWDLSGLSSHPWVCVCKVSRIEIASDEPPTKVQTRRGKREEWTLFKWGMDPNGFILQDSKEQTNNHHKESCLSLDSIAASPFVLNWLMIWYDMKNSIRWQDPNNNTDTETRCLVYLSFPLRPLPTFLWLQNSRRTNLVSICEGNQETVSSDRPQ